MFQRLKRSGWPYSQPPNVLFDVNWESEQARGLVAWWPMLGGQGGWPVRDKLYGRFSMAPFNTPTWVSDVQRGWSVLFDDAQNEYLQVSTAVLSGPPITLACWFLSDSITLGQSLMSISDSGGNDFFELFAAGATGGDPIEAWTNAANAASTAGYSANVWQHACGVYAAQNDRRAYLNGGNRGNDNTNLFPSGLDVTTIGVLDLGPDNFGYMSGRIADARIYNRALTDTEVYQMYANPWALYRPRIRRLQAMAIAPVAVWIPRPPAAYNILAIY